MTEVKRYPAPEELLPHRYPILQIDYIEEFVEAARISVVKTILPDNPFLEGHFPGYPIMPGVILVEMMFQCCGLYERLCDYYSGRKEGAAGKNGGRAIRIERVTFKREVLPGATLRISATPRLAIMSFRQFDASVYDADNGTLYVEGSVTVSL